MENQPLISIIVAVKNGDKTLQRCIDSVCDQIYNHKELIVIDGNSTDKTMEIIKKNADHISYWESKKDSGVYQAWNNALDHACGEWICFLGSDDYFWNKDCLYRLRHFLDYATQKTRIVYGKVNVVSEKGDILYTIGKPWKIIRKKFYQINCLPHPGLMHHRSIFEEHGKFDESFMIAGDYELLLRVLLKSNALFIPVTLVGMQHGGLSTIKENSIIGLIEMRKALRMHGIRFPGFYWALGLLKSYLKLKNKSLW